MERITSLQNPLIKSLKKLNTSASRRETGLFLLEGIKLCREALDCGIRIRYCLAGDDERALALATCCNGAECFLVSDSVIEKLSIAKTPQKIVMVGEIPEYESNQIEGNMVLALDGISDPANLGSMLRTAEAFGVTDILCSDQTVDLYSIKVLRGAMGSSFRVRVHRGDLQECLIALRHRGYSIYATALSDNNVLLQNLDFSKKCVIVIGNEGNGVSADILALADQTVLIPMAGQNESLNAAAAAAVVLWQGYKGYAHE
ncbi:MAG: RNA methyltransferase [Clostridia bacterium]|nr:RNA methyltransferase [Clostridia bacterium]